MRTAEVAAVFKMPTSRSIFVTLVASALLKGARPKPVLGRLAFRTALPLPQRVSAVAEALILRLAPEVIGPTMRPAGMLPEEIGAIANELIQPLLGLRQHTMRISVLG